MKIFFEKFPGRRATGLEITSNLVPNDKNRHRQSDKFRRSDRTLEERDRLCSSAGLVNLRMRVLTGNNRERGFQNSL